MRVIAGTAKGMRLSAPQGRHIRPTLDRVREALFNILAGRIEEARFLDLFSGTGANGIEALSRGAASATLVDCDPHSIALAKKNLAATRLTPRATTLKSTLPEGLARVHGPFDLIYLDPPHAFTDHDGILQALSDQDLMAGGGLVIVEHAPKTALSGTVGAYTRSQERRYGNTTLSFYS